MIAE
jgi:hypothetical protein